MEHDPNYITLSGAAVMVALILVGFVLAKRAGY
jgi:hypothetical protein